ncbi:MULTISPECIES: DUF5134 domain-containing protein [Micrococcaceae]|uniref:DUF5134 domain-containing protein n=1 Tax=Micrococcaceae TaxID=1268 RepID=UPI001A9924CF|nr:MULTISPECIES: DUF5134 domain-containing protein [Micrococcaceae]QSZ51267.1 hypothetical protein AYX22_22270 [Arthrobacter sp. D5-1]QSZ55609.1 hypothetical protein AYX19_21175 [Paenarthrobacter ureafaciens]
MLAPFLNIPVSLILVAGTAFCLAKAFRGNSWVTRLNYVLHTLMALGMLGMVWHDVRLPLLPQLLLFGTASFWFFLQAVSRHEFALVCHSRPGRLSCLYHAAMLASMVFMLALPHSAGQAERTTMPAHPAPHHGHALTTNVPSIPDVSPLWTHAATQVLAILFAGAVLAWLLPMVRLVAKMLAKKAPGLNPVSWHRQTILERSYEAGAALTMSLMFAATSL